jgi:hypothetical protein
VFDQILGFQQTTDDFNGAGKQYFFGLAGYHIYLSRYNKRRAFAGQVIHPARPFIMSLITAYADGLWLVRAWLYIKIELSISVN